MLLERIYDTDLAQASFFLGCPKSRLAIVIDPRRDIAVYQELAERESMRISHVVETHVHADYLSGSRELAAATGASLHVSAEGGPDWLYGFEAELLHDGDVIEVGELRITAMHTPGHTPEHLSFLLADGSVTDEPGYLFSGDFVFVGDVGRPDLLDAAAGGTDTRFEGARQMYRSLKKTFLALPDHVQVHPAHGSGSACGKALGSVPVTTVGYERRYSWWAPFLEDDDEEGFVAALLDGQPDPPAYFGRMKRQNLSGPAILGPRADLPEVETGQLAADLEAGRVNLVDTRPAAQVHEGTAVGALNIPAPNIATWGGWAVDPESDRARPLIILADDADAAREVWDHLVRVGIDDVRGYVRSLEGLPGIVAPLVAPESVADAERSVLLDVRAPAEFGGGAIPGAESLPGGRVLWNLESLPSDGRILLYCQSGARASVVASTLRSLGHDVAEVEGSYQGWAASRTS